MSKQIPLTKGKFAVVDDEDYEWLTAMGKWYASKPRNSFYAKKALRRSEADGRRITVIMHRIVLEHYDNSAEGNRLVSDHKDGDGLNNQKSNLRWASDGQNAVNRGLQSNNVTKFKGVSKARGKWRAHIMIHYKSRFLGYFTTPETAARAYDVAAVECFGEFAWLNFPVEK